MKAVPPEERAFGPFLREQNPLAFRMDALAGNASLSDASLVDPALADPSLVDAENESPEPYRAVRAPLRDLLDEEFQKNYRFEGISDFSHYIKALWRNLTDRDAEDEYGEFMAGREPRDPHHPE